MDDAYCWTGPTTSRFWLTLRFRLRHLLVAFALVGAILCLDLQWVAWPERTAELLTARLVDNDAIGVEHMLSQSPRPHLVNCLLQRRFESTLVAQPRSARDVLVGRQAFTLKTDYGWLTFTAEQGRVVDMGETYIFGGVDAILTY